MKLLRSLLVGALLAALAGLAYVAERAEPTGHKMARAASRFVHGLRADQKQRAVYSFDNRERTDWYFTPHQQDGKALRHGLPLVDMTASQREAALDLLRSGTSAAGDHTALTIMSLEKVLRELGHNGSIVRNPLWYFFTVFGTPGDRGKWGWRVEGHHLSLNFTIEDGEIVSATPAFFGANPATVMEGSHKGQRTLPRAEDLARQLFRSLDAKQKKVAYRAKNFPEIREATSAPHVGPAQGLAASKMTNRQRQLLADLLHAYTSRMPADVGDAELAAVRKAGLDKVHFAYAGGLEPGKPHTYRLQGPTFVVEFLNVQADNAGHSANHIHSAWRHIGGDFGLVARD